MALHALPPACRFDYTLTAEKWSSTPARTNPPALNLVDPLSAQVGSFSRSVEGIPQDHPKDWPTLGFDIT
jgi:hypothetical protein